MSGELLPPPRSQPLVPRCRSTWMDTDRETHYCDTPEGHTGPHRCVCGGLMEELPRGVVGIDVETP